MLWIGAGVGGGLVCLMLIGGGVWFALRSDSPPAPKVVAVNAVPAAKPPEVERVKAVELPPQPRPAQQQQQPKPQPQPPPISIPQAQTPIPAGPTPAQIDPATVTKVKQATAYIRVTTADGQMGSGTGFFGIEPGFVFTNAHVVGMLSKSVGTPRSIEVILNSGEPKERRLIGTVMGVDRERDLALLKVSSDGQALPPPLPVDPGNNLTELQKVYVFGFPFGENLGKNITISESAVSALRLDKGELTQVQVNGGMNPGNSGGPVVDSRGVVIGVSVSIIKGTQLNFAVPSGMVHHLIQGRFVETRLNDPISVGGEVQLPVEAECLDPLRRVREVKFETWMGNPGNPRPGTSKPPMTMAGDGVRLAKTAIYQNGKATAELSLPPREPNKVLWVQPSLVSAAGTTIWGTAESIDASQLAPIQRQAAELKLDFAKVPERTVSLKRALRVYVSGNSRVVASETITAKLWERSSVIPGGGRAEVHIGDVTHDRETSGQAVAVPKDPAAAIIRRYPMTFDMQSTGHLRGHNAMPPAPGGSEAVYLEAVELIDALVNGFEGSCVAVADRLVQPRETWQARVPLLLVGGTSRDTLDLNLQCEFDGVRVTETSRFAVIRVKGTVAPRKFKSAKGGTVTGTFTVDLDNGYIAASSIRTASELTDGGGNVIHIVSDTILSREPGNIHNIARAPNPGRAPSSGPQPTQPAGPTGDQTAKGNLISLLPGQILSNAPRREGGKANNWPYKKYSIQLVAGRDYVIEMIRDQPQSTFDPYLILENNQNEVVAEDDDGAGNLNARIRYTPPATGLYYIFATSLPPHGTARFKVFVYDASGKAAMPKKKAANLQEKTGASLGGMDHGAAHAESGHWVPEYRVEFRPRLECWGIRSIRPISPWPAAIPWPRFGLDRVAVM